MSLLRTWFLLASVSFVTALVPRLASAQRGFVVGAVPAPPSGPSTLSDPAHLGECFRECFAANASLRGEVCGVDPHPGACLARNTPACVHAARAYAAGADVLVAARCSAAVAPSVRSAVPVPDERRRRLRAAGICRGEGHFAAACARCMQTPGFSWMTTATLDDPSVLRTAMNGDDSMAAEAYFRCQPNRMLPVHRLIADTRRQAVQVETRLRTVETQTGALQRDAAVSADTAVILDRIIGAILRSQQVREYDRAQGQMERCQLQVQLPPHRGRPWSCVDLQREVAMLAEALDTLYAPDRGTAQLASLRAPLVAVRSSCRDGGDAVACMAARERLRGALGLEARAAVGGPPSPPAGVRDPTFEDVQRALAEAGAENEEGE